MSSNLSNIKCRLRNAVSTTVVDHENRFADLERSVYELQTMVNALKADALKQKRRPSWLLRFALLCVMVMSVEWLFPSLPAIGLLGFFARLFVNGSMWASYYMGLGMYNMFVLPMYNAGVSNALGAAAGLQEATGLDVSYILVKFANWSASVGLGL